MVENQEKKLKVFLMGGDRAGWALDTELSLAAKAISPFTELVNHPRHADVLHTVCAEEMIESPVSYALQKRKPVVAVFSNDPKALFERVPGLLQESKRWFCVAQSTDAERKLHAADVPFVRKVLYAANLKDYVPLNRDSEEIQTLRKKLQIPEGAYVLGSFQRDSEGSDLNRFKVQKGADVFVDILVELKKIAPSLRVHVLLAGPRRHWIRAKLQELGISFSFDGEEIKGDDFPKNILGPQRINQLMHLIDCYVVSSRWEGGPRAILEACSAEIPIISTDVGVASDLLDRKCIFYSVSEAAKILEKDSREKFLSQFLKAQKERLRQAHSLEAASAQWRSVYRDVAKELMRNGTEKKSTGIGFLLQTHPLYCKVKKFVQKLYFASKDRSAL